MSHLFTHNLNVKEFYLTLSGATTGGQGGPRNYGYGVVLRIPQSSNTGTSTSDCLVIYLENSLGLVLDFIDILFCYSGEDLNQLFDISLKYIETQPIYIICIITNCK